MTKVFFKTFGCRTNLFDTQVMKSNLRHFESTSDESEADIIVVNSCTVTNSADSGVRNYLHKMRNKKKRVYFTGCGVATKGEEIFKQKLAHSVFAHSFKEKIDGFLLEQAPFFYSETTPMYLDRTFITEFLGKSRAFLKIQEGCDFACSYCIIPFARGNARSMPKEKILKEIENLASKGVSEVVLTGTNVGSYGKEFEKYNLASLIKDIYHQNFIKRLRIGSLEPSQINEEFLECLDLPLLERHLHIALQHTSDTMLEIMNRQNRVQSDLALCEILASKGFCLGSDFIVGHPGESEKVWQETWEMFKKYPLTHLHPFVYSQRDGTHSATMKNTIKGDVARQRLHCLKEYVAQNNIHFRNTHKEPLEVLCESKTKDDSTNVYSGLDQFFNRVRIYTDSEELEGQWLHIKDYEIKQEGNDAQI